MAGRATAPATSSPPSQRATWTAQSLTRDLRELTRAVQRVDDPDAVCVQTCRVVGRLLAQHRVRGPMAPELRGQVLLRPQVAGRLERGRLEVGLVATQLEQHPPCRFGNPTRESRIVQRVVVTPRRRRILLRGMLAPVRNPHLYPPGTSDPGRVGSASRAPSPVTVSA